MLSLKGALVDQLCKTRTVMKSLNPVFNECFAFEIDGKAVLERAKDAPRVLRLDVFDYDWMKADDFLGSCELGLPELVDLAIHNETTKAPGRVAKAWTRLAGPDGETAALLVSRRYVETGGTVFERSHNIYPGSRYVMTNMFRER